MNKELIDSIMEMIKPTLLNTKTRAENRVEPLLLPNKVKPDDTEPKTGTQNRMVPPLARTEDKGPVRTRAWVPCPSRQASQG